jgi:hypothetical protein
MNHLLVRRVLLPVLCGTLLLVSRAGLTTCVAQVVVVETRHSALGDRPLHAYVADLELPMGGWWRLENTRTSFDARELYLMPLEAARKMAIGERMRSALIESQTSRGRWKVQMGYEACRAYAQAHGGRGPSKVADLADISEGTYAAEHWEDASALSDPLAEILASDAPAGPAVYLIPDVEFHFDRPSDTGEADNGRAPASAGLPRRVRQPRWTVASEARTELAFELRPFADDGKHWVLYTDGSCKRVAIDPEMLRRFDVEVRPWSKDAAQAEGTGADTVRYRLAMVSAAGIDQEVPLTLRNPILDREQTVVWDLAAAIDGPPEEVRAQLMSTRQFAWEPYARVAGGGVLHAWKRSVDALPSGPESPRNLSTFAVLGGRAAIEETLQLQDLQATESSAQATIDIDSLTGVEVESHPFADMLGERPGGQLELANYVPPDRFLVHVGQPQAMPAFLDAGAPFLSELGVVLTGNALQYELEKRYLERFGMTRQWLDQVLAANLIDQFALFTPDLFFIDGTDVTVVAKLKQPAMMRTLLGLLGAGNPADGNLEEFSTASGQSAYLAMRGELLWLSTNRDELTRSLQLHDRGGEGSLGTSDEFRYMLTKLPLEESTRAYVYFSDPFVRRLVGPEVKIGQMRRVREKTRLEVMTAAVMRAQLDGRERPTNLEALANAGYLPDTWPRQGYEISELGIVHSGRYGTLRRTRTLNSRSLEKVTPREAEAYNRYRENYSRYWRRFFDPIAIRLSETAAGELELATFILPLVDNSIYNAIREAVVHAADQTPLLMPVVEPEPVLQFSVNFREQVWQQIAGGFSDFFARFSGLSSVLLDDLGPSVHVAVFDADPIIAVGSGDIFGAFGGDLMRGGGDQMLMVPVALSMLTRPSSIMVETRNPERTRQFLRQAALGGIQADRNRDFQVSFHRVGDRDEWVWTIDLFGVVKLRYGLEVSGKFLVIRNIPWSAEDRIVSLQPAALNGAALQAFPGACELQLPSLHASATDTARKAAMSGLGRLYPFMLGGQSSVAAGLEQHRQLFGFAPRPIQGDQWKWNNFRLTSERFGTPNQQRQPEFDPTRPFGLMQRVNLIELNMQFEDDGLRSSIRWRLR